MKRLLCFSVIMLMVLAACVETAEDDDSAVEDSESQPTATQVSETPQQETAPTASPEQESDPTATPDPTSTATPAPEPTQETEETDTDGDTQSESYESEAAEGDEAEEEIPEEVAGEIDVQVRQQNTYVTSTGTLSVFGEIENLGEGHAELQEVLITIRADDGSVIDSGDALSYISVVEGGEAVPFYGNFLEVSDEFAEIEIDVEARNPEDAWIRIFENYREFETLQADWNSSEFSNSIVGEIENVGDEAAEFVEIFAAGYDSEGQITFVQTTFSDRDLIRPGDASPFTIDFIDPAVDEPAEIRIFAEGWISDAE